MVRLAIFQSLAFALGACAFTGCMTPSGTLSFSGGSSSSQILNLQNWNDMGSGTAGDPYQIYTPAQIISLASTSTAWTYDFSLMSDINMQGLTLPGAIGNSVFPLMGTFNGQGFQIQNLQPGGLTVFGQIGSSGILENVIFTNLSLTSSSTAVGVAPIQYNTGLVQNVTVSNSTIHCTGPSCNVGGIVALNGGTISNSTVTNTTISGTGSSSSVGGIAGTANATSSISGATVASGVSISGPTVGGIAGNLYSSASVQTSVAMASLSVSNAGTGGGLVGVMNSSTSLLNSYAGGSISGSTAGDIGGVVGDLIAGTISNTYSAGSMTGTMNYAGGLLGLENGGSIQNSFSVENIDVSASFGDYLIGKQSSGTASGLSYSSSVSCANPSVCSNATVSSNYPLSDYESTTPMSSTVLGGSGFTSSPWLTLTGSALPQL